MVMLSALTGELAGDRERPVLADCSRSRLGALSREQQSQQPKADTQPCRLLGLRARVRSVLCPWSIRQLTARSDLFRYVVEAHEAFALLKGNRLCVHQLTIGLHESAGLDESRCT